MNQSAALLGAYFTNYNATLTFDVTSEDNSSSSTLASAGSDTVGLSTGFVNTVVQEKILTNGATDANGTAADGFINWNFGTAGGWDLDDTVSATAFDFKSTAMHELLHAFGFTAQIGANGAGLLSGVNVGTEPDQYGKSENFMTDFAGNRLVSAVGVFNSSELGDLTGGTGNNGVFFSGAHAVAANGNKKVNLFPPNPYDNGSSIAHLDDNFFTTQDLLMEASTDPGQGTRTLSSIEIGFLKDIGYTQINPIPVPAALWFMGTGLLGLFGIRRKSKVAV